MLTQVPAHKILLGKRVLTISEDDERVKVQTSDNSIYEGDILVGADGAYSAVRQRLYETLKQQDRLPKSDQEDLPFNCTCLVGQTEPLDLEEFPQLKDTGYPFIFTLGREGRPYTVCVLIWWLNCNYFLVVAFSLQRYLFAMYFISHTQTQNIFFPNELFSGQTSRLSTTESAT